MAFASLCFRLRFLTTTATRTTIPTATTTVIVTVFSLIFIKHGAPEAPFWSSWGVPGALWSHSGALADPGRHFVHFLAALGTLLAPKGRPREPKRAPKTPKRRPKRPQRAQKSPKRRPREAQRASKARKANFHDFDTPLQRNLWF